MDESAFEQAPAGVERAPDVVAVELGGGFTLRLTFEDGQCRLFDVTPYLPSSDGTRGEAFRPLLDPAYFGRVRVEHGTVVWPDGQDFDPATLYTLSEPALT